MSARALARGADYPAFEWDRRWIDWAQMRQVAEAANRLIAASGAAPDAPVAFLPRNRPALLAALTGVFTTGRSIRMIHVYQSPAAVAGDLVRLKPAVVLGAPEDLSEEVCAVLRRHGVAAIALGDMTAQAVPGCERSTIETDPAPPQPQIWLLTSGTTGPPKQFALSYDNIAEHMVGFNLFDTQEAMDPLAMAPIYNYLAFSTITGLYLSIPAMMHGFRSVLVERFTVPTWRDYVLRHRPATGGVPPPALQMILEADIPPQDLASIKYMGSGAAPVDPTVQREFEARYGIPVLLSYGATEMGGPVTRMTLEMRQQWGEAKMFSVGRAWAGTQLRVVDPDTGEVLAPNQDGVLEARTVRIGPEWIRTSDQVRIDEDGFVFILGRADGAIIRGGFKLLPDAIERALVTHEAVAAAGVVGMADKRLGQLPAAVIQLRKGAARPSVAELEAHLREHVPATHIPVAWRFVDVLPLTNTLKIHRPALRQMFETVDQT
jgi:acyl-CoA synthetase (AMP-forming)/AMP-acid ligase II